LDPRRREEEHDCAREREERNGEAIGIEEGAEGRTREVWLRSGDSFGLLE